MAKISSGKNEERNRKSIVRKKSENNGESVSAYRRRGSISIKTAKAAISMASAASAKAWHQWHGVSIMK